ncbi:cytochrome b561 [Pseudaminobacter salicylatoxidans]|uniref:Cytochrome b561 n=1 Tax=Pseudaminobacter salicylatoxidans TaxID=93369 RepID=A0A316C5H6_PSESE|nr:cytochrome b [Pseudaminobacter salicylatoxidans]PWJ84276.1 cytochrome b561 [Pseudaminobacter salicylatoxidans]
MLRNGSSSYGLVAILIHWTIAALFVGQMLLGLAPRWVASMALQFTLIQWHKSFGFLILALAALRLLWAATNRWPRRPPALGHGEWMAAKSVQGSLYLLMLVLPLTGWALVSTSTLGVPSFAFNVVVIPDLPMSRSEATEEFWRVIHQWLAYATAAIATGHMLAALRHEFWLRDGILKRMWPPRGNEADEETTNLRKPDRRQACPTKPPHRPQ